MKGAVMKGSGGRYTEMETKKFPFIYLLFSEKMD